MTVLQQLRSRRLLTALIAVTFYVCWFTLPHVFADAQNADASNYQNAYSPALYELALVATVIVFAWLMGDWRAMRITSPPTRGCLLPMVVPALYLAFFTALAVDALIDAGLSGTALMTQKSLYPIAITVVLVGIFEEFLFRGILFSTLERARGTVVAIAVTSIAFGLFHYVNVLDGQSFDVTTYQVVHAAGAGLLFAGIMLVTGSIWFAVAFHALWDWTVFHFQAAASIAISEGNATTLVKLLANAQGATNTILETFTQFLTLGVEPAYGLVLIAIYMARKRNQT